ncbi:MAG: hypothetical protein Q4Q33_10615 [Eubacteriales bacterium]|nr:hypothetical protein [Eubacteriales bacterium]
MKEMINKSLGFWNNYWGDSLFPWLLAVSVLYLLIFRHKKKTVRSLLAYAFLELFLFFFPVTAKIIQKCIGESVYWRVLWTVPFVPVIALAMAEFVRARKRFLQPVLIVVFAVLIAFGGKEFLTEGYFHQVYNYQQVPDEVAGVCELASLDAGGEKFLMVADEYISSYIRVYDPSIYMPFGRRGSGGAVGGRKQLYLELNAPVFNYSNIGDYAKRVKCNYLVVKIPNEQQKAELENYDYHELGVIGTYSLYRLGNSVQEYRSPLLETE